MSKVETAKTLIPALAKGLTNDASTPTTEKSIVPATRRHRQPGSAWIPGGTWDSPQTMESSTGVRVIEKNWLLLAQAGIAASGGSLPSDL